MISTLIRAGSAPQLDKYREEYLVDTETNEIIFPKVLSSGVISPDSIQNPGGESSITVKSDSMITVEEYKSYHTVLFPGSFYASHMYFFTLIQEIEDLEVDCKYYISLRTTKGVPSSTIDNSFAMTTANNIVLIDDNQDRTTMNTTNMDVLLCNPIIVHTHGGGISPITLSGIFIATTPKAYAYLYLSPRMNVPKGDIGVDIDLFKLKFK